MNKNMYRLDINSTLKELNYRDLMIFIVPIIIFTVYLSVYNPGILTIESFNQLHQIATGKYTNLYPAFHTFIEILCLKLFGSPLYVCILQILIFSLIWVGICKYNRDDSLESSNQFLLQFIVTLIICLIPINASYSITLWSDILFSYSLLFLCLLIKIVIDNKGHVDSNFVKLLAITMAITSQLSTNGIYVILITLIVLTVYLFKKNESSKMHIFLPALTIVLILFIGSLNIAYEVGDSTPEVTSLVLGDSDLNLNINDVRDQYYASINQTPKKSFEQVSSANTGNWNYKLIDSYVHSSRSNIVLDTLFNNPIVYMIFAIILLVFIQRITKSREIYLIYVPILANILFVFLLSPNKINHHLYSNLLVFYLIIIILISLLFRADASQHITDESQMKSEKQEDISYIENDSDSYTEYDSTEDTYDYYETEIENLSLDDINSILNEKSEEEPIQKSSETSDESDLIDQILNEMEMEKEN